MLLSQNILASILASYLHYLYTTALVSILKRRVILYITDNSPIIHIFLSLLVNTSNIFPDVKFLLLTHLQDQ